MDQEINNIELNAILYYADFLSLKAISIPVTDNCKYFYIHGTPINSCYILDLEPIYDQDNKYFKQSFNEYIVLRNKFGEDGVISFIENLASLSARGCVTAQQMLSVIHQYSSKIERKQAFVTYDNWNKNKRYTHTFINDDGKLEEHECSMYVYHVERSLKKRGLLKSLGTGYPIGENNTLESLL